MYIKEAVLAFVGGCAAFFLSVQWNCQSDSFGAQLSRRSKLAILLNLTVENVLIPRR
jgi:hypothetical protein